MGPSNISDHRFEVGSKILQTSAIPPRLIRHSGAYLLANGLGRGLPVILLPLLTRILSVEDYGRLSIVATVTGLLAILVGLNPHLFVIAHFFRYSVRRLSILVFNIILVGIITALPWVVGYPFVAPLLNSLELPAGVFFVIVFVAFTRLLANLYLSILQMSGRPGEYLRFNAFLSFGMCIVLLSMAVLGTLSWTSMLYAEALLGSVMGIYGLKQIVAQGYLTAKRELRAGLEFVQFSSPLLAHVLALWVINFVDRLLLAEIVDVEAVGVYSAASTVALGLSVVHESVSRAWQPVFFKRMQKEEREEQKQIVRFIWSYYFISLVALGFYVWGASWVARLFLPGEYLLFFEYLPILAVGYTFLGLYRLVAGYCYHYQDTKALAILTTACAAINVVANIVLIKWIGAIGAAYATVISYLFLFLAVKVLTVRRYHVRWILPAGA